MLAKVRDVSTYSLLLKNVARKNIKVKKLAYVYLARNAEEQQDLALLFISTFQRARKYPSQLIRASALRVGSSIRVEEIVIVNMFTRYARTHFTDPNLGQTESADAVEENSDDDDGKDNSEEAAKVRT